MLISSCATLNNASQYQLRNDRYEFRQPGSRYTNVYIEVKEDTVSVTPIGKNATSAKAIQPGADELFRKRSFDLDVLVVPFKYRPSSSGFPRQLNTDFNGNIFLGYRLDRFQVHFRKTPVGLDKQMRHRAVTAGIFGGFGSASISPSTTNYGTIDSYNGFILSRGLAIMMGVNNLTVGVGVGWDYLTDRDKNIWIYQNKSWLGLILSLNLN